MKYEDSSWKIFPKTGRGEAIKETEGVSDGNEWKDVEMLVSTPYGFVRAFSWKWVNMHGKKTDRSGLYIIKDGVEYSRTFKKYYTPRGLVTKGKRFAKEVFEGV